MDKDAKFETWLTGICDRPLSTNELAQTRIFSKELAEGVTKKFWSITILTESISYSLLRLPNISHPPDDNGLTQNRIDVVQLRETDEHYENFAKNTAILSNENIVRYLQRRWEFDWPETSLLEVTGLIERTDRNHLDWRLTNSAFEFLKEVEPITIFISYKRRESSAFAMYILTRLKAEGLEAFVDMSLIPGEDWHAGLKKRIYDKEYDYLIALIGKQTLKSPVCIEEIEWALDAGLEIIPVWHNKFKFVVPNKWALKPKIEDALAKKHAIQVKEESASGYNTAMAELLNRFWITP